MTRSKALSIALLMMLSGCGGSSSTSNSTPSNLSSGATIGAAPSCVTQWSATCTFSSSDPLQSAQGWWSGKRLLSNGESQSAYALVNASNGVQIYLGDQLNAGQLKGNLSLSGSQLSALTLVGTDQTASASNSTSLNISTGTGGAVSAAHLSLQVSRYLPDPSNSLATPLSMQMNLDYNPLGTNPLSSLAGQYLDATGDTLSINASGNVSMTYGANVYQIDQGVNAYITCKDNYNASPLSALANLTLNSATANNCGVTNSITLMALPTSAKPKIAVLGLGKTYLFQ